MKKWIIACAMLCASAGFAQEPASHPGSAQADSGSAEAAAQGDAASGRESEEKICKSVVQTSTRLGRRKECKTRAEWEAETRRSTESAGRF